MSEVKTAAMLPGAPAVGGSAGGPRAGARNLVYRSPISSHRHAPVPVDALHHQQCRVPLRGAIALQQLRVHYQSVAVLDQDIAAVGQLRFMPATFARQSRI